MIEIDSELLDRIQKELEGITNGIESVVSGAANKAALETKRDIVGRIIDEYYIDKKPINESITIKRANKGNTVAQVRNNRKKDSFTLKRFKVDIPSNGPIKVAQSRSGGIKELRRGFVNAPKNQPGNPQVFRRDGGNRNPISLQRGHSTGGMLETNDVIEFIEGLIQERLEKNLGKEVEKFFEK